MPHPQYPRLLPQGAHGPSPLRPFDLDLRTRITTTLQLVPVETTRVFLALCNYNLLAHATNEDRQYANGLLGNASARELTRLGEQFSSAIRQWIAVGGGRPGSSSSGPRTARSTITVNMARERDNNLCVISQTGAPTPTVAHIVPYSIGRDPRALEEARPDVFRFLTFLAGPSVVRQLKEYLFNPTDPRGRTRINRLENLICLSPSNHTMFGYGLFVLEPVGDPLASLGDNGELWSYEVKFSWVPQNQPRRVNGADRSWDLAQVLDPGVQLPEDEDQTLAEALVFRSPRQLRQRARQGRNVHVVSVETGFVFSLTTTDPNKHPLPHPDLLALHAAVMQIARAAGAANIPDTDDWPLSEDGSDIPIVQGVPEDLSYALREYLNDFDEAENDNHLQR
ncbi:hypothetical protein BGX38DRAFT_1276775 [Terfezia claveryi]|nr:hypothetical protein BGX38DRAFT_1276775 [Terfezia claveryi]